jgi:hypothetical protein
MENRIKEILADSTIGSLVAKDGNIKIELELYTEEIVEIVFSDVQSFVARSEWSSPEEINCLVVDEQKYSFKNSFDEVVLEIEAKAIKINKSKL